jgi:single-strand DNA-binding protein
VVDPKEKGEMKSINKVTLIGHVGKQPEIRYTQGGAPVGNFSLATNEYWTTNTGERGERTEWHRIVAWGKLAEFCQEYVQKGSYLYIEGRIQTRSYDDRDGVKRYITEIRANEIGLLDKKTAGEPASAGMDAPPIDSLPGEPGTSGGDDEVPF